MSDYTRPPVDAVDATWQPPGYARPAWDAANAAWAGAEEYVYPLINAVHVSWQVPGYTRPPWDAADATWATGTAAEVVWATLSATIPPAVVPALTLTASARQLGADTDATVAATIPAAVVPPLSLSASAQRMHNAVATATLPIPTPAITCSMASTQILDLPDADGPGVHAPHRHLPASAAPLAISQQQMQVTHTPARSHHQHGERVAARLHTRHTDMLRNRQRCSAPYQHGIPVGGGTRCAHAEAIRLRSTRTDARHQHGIPIRAGTALPYAEAIRRRQRISQHHHHALPTATRLADTTHQALHLGKRLDVRQQQAIPPAPGYWWPYGILCSVVTWQGVEAYTRPLAWQSDVTWQGAEEYTRPIPLCRARWYPVDPVTPPPEPEPGQIIIPIREVYIVINQFSLTRVSDGEPIPATDCRASIDADSWTWSWSASMPANALELVRQANGYPVELMATFNGQSIRVLVESVRRDRRFGSATLRISGRGRAAWLAEPYSPIDTRHNAEQRTAQQLLQDALTINGVPIDWALDWQIDDWQVPAGIWSHTGSYIAAAQRIAEAGGAYVQAHDTLQTLRILPRYPIAPWLWSSAVPDIILPEDVVEVEGIDWQERPNHNAVWIHGGDQGRADRIRRTGTAADRYAETIVDPLATDPIMTRQRGLAVLGNTGKQAHISLRLPVLPETGLIRPGKLIEYTEQGNTHRGISRALSIDQDYPDLWQTITLETHEEATA